VSNGEVKVERVVIACDCGSRGHHPYDIKIIIGMHLELLKDDLRTSN